LDILDDEDQKPEDVKRFVEQFKKWNLNRYEESGPSNQEMNTRRNSSIQIHSNKKDQKMNSLIETPVLFNDE
jgi:hypothetical protein